MAILPWILILVLLAALAAVLYYVLRRDSLREEELRRERDAYREAFLEASKVKVKAFGAAETVEPEPVPQEVSDEQWRETWSELDEQAYASFCRGLAEEEYITQPEDQWAMYLRRYGRQLPFEIGRV